MTESDPRELSPALEELLRRLPSIEHVEVALLMAAEPLRDWTPDDVAGKLFGDTRLTGRVLADLASAGLASASSTGGRLGAYRYEPRSHPLRVAMDELRQMYSRFPFEVMRAIARRPPRAIQALSDAFRDRKSVV